MNTYKEDKNKEKAISSKQLHIGCLCCSTATLKAPLNNTNVVGFGDAHISFSGKLIYDGEWVCIESNKGFA